MYKQFSDFDIICYNGIIAQWGIMKFLIQASVLQSPRIANMTELAKFYKRP